jgi:hypothetical protein
MVIRHCVYVALHLCGIRLIKRNKIRQCFEPDEIGDEIREK